MTALVNKRTDTNWNKIKTRIALYCTNIGHNYMKNSTRMDTVLLYNCLPLLTVLSLLVHIKQSSGVLLHLAVCWWRWRDAPVVVLKGWFLLDTWRPEFQLGLVASCLPRCPSASVKRKHLDFLFGSLKMMNLGCFSSPTQSLNCQGKLESTASI